MRNKNKSRILTFLLILTLASIFIHQLSGIKEFPESYDGKWQKFVTVARLLHPAVKVANSFGIVLLIVCASWFYQSDKKLGQDVDVPYFAISARIHYYVLLFNVFLALIRIFLGVSVFLVSRHHSLIKWFFGVPLIHICWLGVVLKMLSDDRKYIKGIIEIDRKYS